MGVECVQGDQCGGLHVNLKNTKIGFSIALLSQLFLKYACAVDVLVHQCVYTKFPDGTLPILLNFKKKQFVNKLDLTSFKFSAIK